MEPVSPFFSIVVPVLNEATIIAGFLQGLRTVAPTEEIIVVDGGSSDGTREIARPLADCVIVAPRGRASQMNAGARIARGEVLWFLHADSQVPADSIAQIKKSLAGFPAVGGCFRLRFPRTELIYRVSDSLGNIGVSVFGFALGDHGIFCRRSAFDVVGGYPDVPILEDAEIYRRLRRQGGMLQLRGEIISSPRMYESHGVYRTTAVYFSILALYVLGVSIEFLNQVYLRFHGRRWPVAEPGKFAHAIR